MSKNIYNPLNLDNPVHIDFNDMSDHESINHCFGEMNNFYGKKHTEEYKEQKVHDSRNQWYNAPQEYRDMMVGYTKQMGLNNKGRKHTEEFKRNKVIETSGSNNPMYGKKHSTETRQKMSIAAKNRRKQNERCME